MSNDSLNLTLKVWRQAGPNDDGRFETYEVNDISPDMSFLEMFDVLNEQRMEKLREVKSALRSDMARLDKLALAEEVSR